MTATSKRILLVDDEELVREVCSELLSSEGYQVDTASDGVAALSRMEDAGYDLIVLDINMPRLDGIDFYRKAAGGRPELKDRFLFITGDLYGEGETLHFFCKNASVLKKPFTKKDFLDSVRRILSLTARPATPQQPL